MELGKRIAELRLKKGLTQGELADASEISRGSVINYEKLLTEPGTNILRRVIKASGITWDEFFEGENKGREE